jgi:TP901 family phage tail tape measure protein
MSMPPVLVELKASSSDFMAKMGEARAETAKLSTQGASNLAKFAAVGKAALLGITVGAAAVAVESLKMAADFQSAMELIHTQAGASQAEVDRMSKAVLSLAGSTATAPDELAAGLYHLESSGLHGARALEALKTAAEGAKIGHADLESVTNALNAAIASGIPGVQNMEQAMGALNAVVGSGDMRMQDLADAMGTGVLATVKGFGLSLNDVGAALATFGDNNIRGADAATQLRMAVLFMAKPAKGAESALKSIGLTTKSLADDMAKGGLNKAITDLHDHLQAAGDTGAKAGQVLLDAFGHKAGTGLSILVSQYARFESKTKEVADGARGFGADWQATTKTLSFQMDQLKATAEALAVKIGTALIPKVEAVAKAVANAVDWFKQHRAAALALGTVIGGFLTVTIGAFIVNSINRWVKSLQKAATAMKESGIAARLFGTQAAEGEAAAEAPLLPWIAAVAAVGVAAYELYTHWNTVWGGLKSVAETVWHAALEPVFNALKAAANTVWQVIDTAWHAIDTVINFVGNHIVQIIKVMLAVGLGPLGIAIDILWTHWHTVWDAIKAVTSAVWGFLKPIFDAIVNAGLAVIHREVDGLKNIWNTVWHAIHAAVTTAWNIVKPIFDAIVNAGLAVIHREIDGLKNIWDTVWGGLHKAVEGAWALIKPVLDTMSSALDHISGAINDVKKAAGAVGGALGKVGGFLGFAGGVTSFTGGTAIVGEYGPELVRLPAGADVVPNRQTQAMLGDNSELIAEIRALGRKIEGVPRQWLALERTR